MTLETLELDMKLAWKAGDMAKKSALVNMIDAVKKAAMTPKGRVEITEQLVDETLQKYQKTVQEQYDTCPATPEYMLRRLSYANELTIVKDYAPQLMTGYENIKNVVLVACNGIELTKANKGQIMKQVAPILKGKADMSVVNQVVNDLLV